MINLVPLNSYYQNNKSISNKSYNDVSFYGLKSNIRLGQDVLKDFKTSYPKLKSNTMIELKIEQLSGKKGRAQELISKLSEISHNYGAGVEAVRRRYQGKYPSFDAIVQKMGEVLSKLPFSNCTERSYLIQHKLLAKNEKAHNISITVKDAVSGYNLYNKDHMFTVFGLKKGADLKNPKTWGNNAVIVDGWSNKVINAREGLEQIKDMLGFNPAKHKLEYGVEDLIKIE